ncbi:MAG: glycosyltransferase family 2 protein, partial [Longimicrobiales bacterium]
KSHALNAALEALPDQLVVFLDDDVRFEPDLFEHYHAFGVERGPGTFFGGPVACDYEVEIPEWLLEFLPASVRGWTLGSEVQEVVEPGLLGFNWAAFVSDLKEAGGFDPRFGPGSPTGATGQESEMQTRLMARGATGLFLPGARVWHYVRAFQADPAWCLRRNFRTGIEKALLDARDDMPELFGKPRWTHRELATLVWKRTKTSRSRDPGTRFRPRYELARLRGYRAGWTLAKQLGPRRGPPASRDKSGKDSAAPSGP